MYILTKNNGIVQKYQSDKIELSENGIKINGNTYNFTIESTGTDKFDIFISTDDYNKIITSDPPLIEKFDKKFIELLGKIIKKIDYNKFPNKIFWFIKDVCVIEYRKDDGYFRFSYFIWTELGKEFDLNFSQIRNMSNKMIKKYFGLENIDSTYNSESSFLPIQEYFNNLPEDVIDIRLIQENKAHRLFIELVEGLQTYIDESKYPNRIYWFNKDKCWIEYNKMTRYIFFRNDIIWDRFGKEFTFSYFTIKNLLKKFSEEYFGLVDTQPCPKMSLWGEILENNFKEKKYPKTNNEFEKLFIELISGSVMKKDNNNNFPDKIFWFKDNKCIMEYMVNFKTLCIKLEIWKEIEKKTSFGYMDIQKPMNIMMNKYYGITINAAAKVVGTSWDKPEKYFFGEMLINQ